MIFLEVLHDGGRGTGQHAGTPALRQYRAGVYPGCSLHGAMVAVGNGVWRCLAAGCNCGCRWRYGQGKGWTL